MGAPTGTVTFVFTDIEGSTRNWEASEPAMRAALARHDDLLSRHLGEHGGEVLTERGEGDSFFAVFPTASGAIAAALSMELAIGSEPWPERAPIKVRVAIHTGESGLDHRGPDVNRCARLRSLAHGGQVLVSATDRRAGPGPVAGRRLASRPRSAPAARPDDARARLPARTPRPAGIVPASRLA